MTINEQFCDLCGARAKPNELAMGNIVFKAVGNVGEGRYYSICRDCSRKYEELLEADHKKARHVIEEYRQIIDEHEIEVANQTEPSDWKDQMWNEAVEAKQTEPSTDIGTSDTVYSDTAGYMPRTDCGWK